MSVDVSTLAIQVTANGIQEAGAALGKLSSSAVNAEKRVGALTDRLSELMRVSGSAIGPANGLTGIMVLIANAMNSAATTAQATAQALSQAAAAMGNLTQATQQTSSATQTYSRHGGTMITTLKAMATAAVAYLSIGTAKNIVEQSDSWGMMQAKLKLATGSMEKAKEAQGELFDMAQRLRTPLDDMSKLYTRLAPALGRMGKSAEDTRNMVEGVGLALKLQGATGAEAASTMLQFSQSANAGRLNGAEFNSVAENGVLILRALEDYLGKNQSQLKKMGAQGVLTFDIISAALDAKLPQWRKDFESLPLTFEGALERLKNSWLKAVGEMGQDNELGKRLAQLVGQIEQALPSIVSGVVTALSALTTAIAFVIDNAKPLLTIMAGIAGVAIGKWAAMGVIALTGLVDTLGIVGVAAKAAQVALAFMGGPVGIITGLLAAGYAAWTLWGDEAQTASTKVTAKVKTDSEKRVEAIQFEIDKLNERNAADGKTKPVEPGKALPADIQALQESMITLRKNLTDGGMSDATKTILENTLASQQAEFERKMAELGTLNALKAQNAEYAKMDKYAESRKDFAKKFATPAEAAEAEIKDWKEKLGPTFTDKDAATIREKHLHTGKHGESEAKKQGDAADAAARGVAKLAGETEFATRKMVEHQDATEKLSASERMLFDLNNLLAKTTDAKAQATINGAIADLEAVRNSELVQDRIKSEIAARKDATKTQNEQIQTAEKELASLQDKIAEYGKLKGTVEDYGLTAAKVKLAAMQMMDDGSDMNGEIARQQNLIAVLEQVAAAKTKLNDLSLSDRLTAQLNALKPADFGNGFAEAFGSIGKAVDKAGKSLDQYNKKMSNLEKIRKEADAEPDAIKKSKLLDKIRKQELRDTLDMYGDMAGAVKSFFDKKTAAYKVADAVEKGIRVAQMALAFEDMMLRVTAEKTVIGAKATATTEGMALDATSTASSVGASITKAGASLAAGVAKAFEQMGVWGFVGAGAMIALMATMGVGGGGASAPDPNSAAERQKKQGTGTVLGDETAKSESISKALDQLKGSYNMGLEYSSRMLQALRSIDGGIKGMATYVAQTTGIRGTSADEYAAGVGSSKGALGFSSSSTEMTDSGLQFDPNQRVGAMKNGNINVSGYYDLHKQSSSWWGLSKDSSDEHHLSAVDDRFKQQVSATVTDMLDVTKTAAKGLGVSGAALENQLNNLSLGIDKVSLKGLSGDDLEKELNSAFSKLGDEMANVVMQNMSGVDFQGQQGAQQLAAFQKVGEGSLETLVRLSSGVEQAKMQLDNLGISAIKFTDIENKHGDISAELVRQSIAAKEAGSNVAQFINEIDGSSQDIVDAYKSLVDIRASLRATGLSGDVTRGMIRGAGGLDGLSSGLSDFIDNFYTDTEKAKVGLSKVRQSFADLGLAMPTTKEAFRAVVEGLMHGDEAAQEMAARVMNLSGAYSDAMQAMTDATSQAIDDAKSELSDAYDRESGALKDLKSQMDDYVKALKGYKDSLITGDLSTLSVMEKYQNIKTAYDQNEAKALTGDADAIGKFQALADEFLQLSRQVNASGEGYTTDFQRVLDATDQVTNAAQGKSDEAQTQLDALHDQVKLLISIDESTKTVAEAIAALVALQGGTMPDHSAPDAGAPTDQIPAPVVQDKNYLFNDANAQAIAAQVVALTKEVAGLRADQAAQTQQLTTATYDASAANADTVADGVLNAATAMSYAKRALINLN